RQWKGKGERKPEPRRQDAGDVAADSEKRRLREGNRTSVTEHELKAEHQQRIDATQGQDPQIVKVRETDRVEDERGSAGNQGKSDPCEEPRRQARHLRGRSRPGAARVRRKCLVGGRRKPARAQNTASRWRRRRRRRRILQPERPRSALRRSP